MTAQRTFAEEPIYIALVREWRAAGRDAPDRGARLQAYRIRPAKDAEPAPVF